MYEDECVQILSKLIYGQQTCVVNA